MSDENLYSKENMIKRTGSIKNRMGLDFIKKMEGIVSSQITFKNTPVKPKTKSKWGTIDTSDVFVPPTPSFFPSRPRYTNNVPTVQMFHKINIPEYVKSGVECPYCKFCK